MARFTTLLILVLSSWGFEISGVVPAVAELEPTAQTVPHEPHEATLRPEMEIFVESALDRFEAQGLELPDVTFVFHDDLMPCSGHKGMYHKKSGTLEMCSMDENTLLHELAHAWANHNLEPEQMSRFVSSRGLDSWNDQDDPWERRGTEHVAETIAWALAEDPHHVRWVETLDDGTVEVTHRILTIGVDVDELVANFEMLTGQQPLFRSELEWNIEAVTSLVSPEATRSNH